MQLTIFLPLTEDRQRKQLPTLKKLLKKAKKINTQSQTAASLLGITNEPQLSSAAIDAAAWDIMGANTSWLRADPVTILTDHATAFLVDKVGLTEDETTELLLDLNEFFHKDDFILFAPEAHTWILNIPKQPAIQTIPIAQMIGANIAEKLPQGRDKTSWHTLFTEVQMLLYTHSVNQQRRAQQLPTIDALWFWGEGELPHCSQTTWTAVYSQDRKIKGLCDLTNHAFEWLAPSFTDMIDTLYPDSQNLIIFPEQVNSQTIENEWLQPLFSALKNKRIENLTIILPQQIYLITPKLLNRWWW